MPIPKPPALFAKNPNKDWRDLIVRHAFQDNTDFANAYHESAGRLAGTFGAQPIDDLILLPVLNLWRQAFELRLKEFVLEMARVRRNYLGVYLDDTNPTKLQAALKDDVGHNLHKLLNLAERQYAEIDMGEPFPATIKTLILAFHEADRSGTAFRYAGQLPDTEDYISFGALTAQLEAEWTLLEGTSDWVIESYRAGPTIADLRD